LARSNSSSTRSPPLIPEELQGVETPAALVDLRRARANAERVVSYARQHGISWRPHIKTHKSRTIARLQLEAGAVGLTVATPREAEVMATVTDDLLLAYPVVGAGKLQRLMALPQQTDLKIGLDSIEVLEGVSTAAHAARRTVGVLVEIDVGLGRVGLPGVDDTVELIERVRDARAVEYRGIMFYPGQIRVPSAEQDEGLGQVSDHLGALLGALADRDLAPEIVSGGSTPTLWRSHDMHGVTEIRAGTAIYFDREGVELGIAGPDDLAYTVIASVVSTAVPGQAVVDAGSKALSKEGRGAGGFAAVYGRPEVIVKSLSEEHGVLDLTGTAWRPMVGDMVRIVPNHVCVSVNLQDSVLGWDGTRVLPIHLEGRGRSRFEASS
jgi:D-serine deaminase-like pyridoxal phosphate-dependent protein